MSVLRVDHTAIAVHNLDEALEWYRRLYGMIQSKRAFVPDQQVEVAFLTASDSELELICPVDSTSGVARFLARRGEGLHHIGFLVEDIKAELERLEKEGVELIDRLPRRGVHGLIAFIHPRSMGGMLVELVERVEDQTLQA
jgi:methylmalonyl-CoA/ethylmalonyl-CoA epimerase